MNSDSDNPFAALMEDLEGDFSAVPTTKTATKRPRGAKTLQQKQADRAKRLASKAAKLEKTRRLFREEHPGLIEFLAANTHWSGFFYSLYEGYQKYGSLTDKQIAAIRSAQAKMAARKADKAAQEAVKIAIDLSAIANMFDAAASSGLKRPRYRAEGLTITPAGAASANPGALYVKRDTGEYAGKVVNGKFSPAYGAGDGIEAALIAIAADPKEAAIRWGRKTGSCSCCGRELTNHASVEAGVGPICAGKWGF
jgi:hypothetical protein